MSSGASSAEDDFGSYATAVAVILSQFGTLVAVSCFAGNTRKSLERKTQKRIYQFYGFCQESLSLIRDLNEFRLLLSSPPFSLSSSSRWNERTSKRPVPVITVTDLVCILD